MIITLFQKLNIWINYHQKLNSLEEIPMKFGIIFTSKHCDVKRMETF